MANEHLRWLDTTHPVHDAGTTRASIAGDSYDATTGVLRSAEVGPWQRNERRLRGGDDVLAELARFDWERGPKGEKRYQARRAQATYINFPELMAVPVVGHLFRQAPQAGKQLFFGGLGDVRRDTDRRGQEPTRAELLYYNADGVGNDGSQWDAFWARAARSAMATGHRWIFVEAGDRPPANGVQPTEADELAGRRPYLVELSPADVTNWHYEEGRLAFAVIRYPDRRPRVVDGRMLGNDFGRGYLLLVRGGFQGLGAEYARGGWWKYDGEKNLVRAGSWAATGGEIPLVPLFYERDRGSDERPAMSRAATTELGQVAVSYMNLSSAADFDAWDAASSLKIIAGADARGFNLMLDKLEEGSRWVPLPTPEGATARPEVADGSSGTVAAEVFKTRLEQKFTEARYLAQREASSTPDSSGESKKAGFVEGQAPRLRLFASELEQAQNAVLYFCERRWGITRPSAVVEWPREFDLAPLIDDIAEVFDLQERSGLKSPTLGAELMTQAVRSKALILDDRKLAAIEKEYTSAAEQQASAGAQDRALEDDVADLLGRAGA